MKEKSELAMFFVTHLFVNKFTSRTFGYHPRHCFPSDTYLYSNSPNHIPIVVVWKRSMSWLCILWHIHEQFHFTYLWIPSMTLFSSWLVFRTKNTVSYAKPTAHPLHTHTLIYSMFCLVQKVVLLYRVSLSPFLLGHSFPRCVFF